MAQTFITGTQNLWEPAAAAAAGFFLMFRKQKIAGAIWASLRIAHTPRAAAERYGEAGPQISCERVHRKRAVRKKYTEQAVRLLNGLRAKVF